ncbi:MAG: hypothetical protein HW405_763 [Candidatus Berkelbacteria bacterium]|nr:hypothetical protein [Candidatus Berkelbacteria bacterium]
MSGCAVLVVGGLGGPYDSHRVLGFGKRNTVRLFVIVHAVHEVLHLDEVAAERRDIASRPASHSWHLDSRNVGVLDRATGGINGQRVLAARTHPGDPTSPGHGSRLRWGAPAL